MLRIDWLLLYSFAFVSSVDRLHVSSNIRRLSFNNRETMNPLLVVSLV